MTNPDTATTLDFGPLLKLRAELAPHLAGLCERIVDGDPEAILAGQAFLKREERIERDLNAKAAAMYDPTSRWARENETARRLTITFTVADRLPPPSWGRAVARHVTLDCGDVEVRRQPFRRSQTAHARIAGGTAFRAP